MRVWEVAAIALAALYLAPILAVFWAATGDSAGLWSHLASTVLPRYVSNTLILMLGVGAVSLAVGVACAWAVTRFEFTGVRALSWLLLLPAAAPAYIVAYAYVDFLEFAGPVQKALREAFGWRSARDYWFPEIRSMGGAVLIMSSVLYPYVYMLARSAFLQTPSAYREIAQVSQRNFFWSVDLPLARPAIIAGLSLVLMETISDFGTVEFFAIETMTLGIFNVWLGMNSLAAAAQISVLCFAFILALLALEGWARRRRKFTNPLKRASGVPPKRVRGAAAIGLICLCAAPILIGFVLPVAILGSFVVRGQSLEWSAEMGAAAFNSLTLAGVTAFCVMLASVVLLAATAWRDDKAFGRIAGLASTGYAFPGTILAIGVLFAAAAFDRAAASVTGGAWLTASFAVVVFACAVRFQAVGFGAAASGLGRLSPDLLHVSRTLGKSFGQSVAGVVLPLIRKSLLIGFVLVFVDVMKELPMTLLLRPFDYETLPTFVYQYAKDELLEEAALPALCIVLTGLIPVLLLNAALIKQSRA